MNWQHYVAGIAAFGILIAILAGGAIAISKTRTHNAKNFTVTNETVVVDYDTASAVTPPGEAASFFEDEIIYNASGAQLEEGDDYRWNATTGEITWLNTSETTAGSEATITYRYHGWSKLTTNLGGIVQDVYAAAPYLALVVGGVVAIGGLMIPFGAYVAKTGLPSLSKGGR